MGTYANHRFHIWHLLSEPTFNATLGLVADEPTVRVLTKLVQSQVPWSVLGKYETFVTANKRECRTWSGLALTDTVSWMHQQLQLAELEQVMLPIFQLFVSIFSLHTLSFSLQNFQNHLDLSY